MYLLLPICAFVCFTQKNRLVMEKGERKGHPFESQRVCWNPMTEEDEVAIITEAGDEKDVERKEDSVIEVVEEEASESEESEDEEEEYIKASRYSFKLSKDSYIFDFQDVDPEEESDESENNNENEENDENEEEEEEENEKDGMEVEGAVEEEMTEQQRVGDGKALHW